MAALQPVGSLPGIGGDQVMGRVSLIAMLAALAGIFWVLESGGDNHSAAARGSEAPAPGEVTAGDERDLPVTVTTQSVATTPTLGQIQVTGSQLSVSASFEAQSKTLNQASGRELRDALETFWLACSQQGNCSEHLAVLKEALSAERYALLADYLVRKDAWQQILGELDLAQNPEIAERVEIVKTQARMVWGAEADELFADEFALYDFKLESRALADSSPEAFIDSYLQLVDRWQSHSDALAIESNTGLYEQAVALIPAHYTALQRQEVTAQLAQLYLSESEQVAIAQRRQEVAQQTQQVRDYQSELSQLKQELADQRATTYASMPEVQWQSYSQQQIADFRQAFFAP
ncbi:chromosome partitioning protein ParA [Photobacterium atrarenae]|uniref:Chromosome partitioning protein ParA n=1 Tax=Photobacterium atrarenae TaxID=865757 RepID=A0ABY5GP81_9GAMM|nr:chromosome partitioning protein ParA [Photobacterium atrarenae]UTV30966.1 chromosome partitioning protein ParA [Photobacterium atrarenae]